MANRLSREKSVYLKQHQDNPVDWFPWGDDALQLARESNKPILLSIGYSACHWCHVMAHESFEDHETALLMNERFINIKVDREERPDLDLIYQSVAQAMTRGGGWPLTVFLTPDLKPFFGGTYFPPTDRYGRPGFKKVLQALSEAYSQQKQDVEFNAQKLIEIMRKQDAHLLPETISLSEQDILENATRELIESMDPVFGGFGQAPKFPNTTQLTFLWRMGSLKGNLESCELVLLTLEKMACGGIYDQLGGGFSRYSVDQKWSVPHFEKMLYDNALLLKLYSEVIITNDLLELNLISEVRIQLFQKVIRETVRYFHREMRHESGLFFSAQDADSEGEEGKFFSWTLDELKEVLSQAEFEQARIFWGVTAQGQLENGAHVFTLNLEQWGQSEVHKKKFGELQNKLFQLREKRIKPGLDDKCLTSWNGFAISGLTWASEALRRLDQIEESNLAKDLASTAFQASLRLCLDSDQKLSTLKNVHYGRSGSAYLDDYASMAVAALDLSRQVEDGSEKQKLFLFAENCLRQVIERFSDKKGAGYFFTAVDHESLIHRPKTFWDQATPSGVAMVLWSMSCLVELGVNEFDSLVQDQLRPILSLLSKQAYSHGELLNVLLARSVGFCVLKQAEASNVFYHPFVLVQWIESDALKQEGSDSSLLTMVCFQKSCSLPFPHEKAAHEIKKRWNLKTH